MRTTTYSAQIYPALKRVLSKSPIKQYKVTWFFPRNLLDADHPIYLKQLRTSHPNVRETFKMPQDGEILKHFFSKTVSGPNQFLLRENQKMCKKNFGGCFICQTYKDKRIKLLRLPKPLNTLHQQESLIFVNFVFRLPIVSKHEKLKSFLIGILKESVPVYSFSTDTG